MAIKDSGKVTITLNRRTVEVLRSEKRGLETWDELMKRLGGRRRYGIECVFCGAFIETSDLDMSPNLLAKANEWRKVYSEKTERKELGYMCERCGRTR